MTGEEGMPETTLLLTAAEAARALKVSPRRLRQLTASGEIRRVMNGVRVLYPVSELERWIAEKMREESSAGVEPA